MLVLVLPLSIYKVSQTQSAISSLLVGIWGPNTPITKVLVTPLAILLVWNAVCKPLCVCIISGVCTWKGVREFFRACVYSCVYMKVVCVYHYSCQYTHPIWYNTHLVYTCSTLMHTQHWNTCDSIYTHEFYKLPAAVWNSRLWFIHTQSSYTHRGLQTALCSQTREIFKFYGN